MRPNPGRKSAEPLAGELGAGQTLQQQRDVQHTADASLPQYANRRRFIVWSILAGFASGDRLSEAVLAEVAPVLDALPPLGCSG